MMPLFDLPLFSVIDQPVALFADYPGRSRQTQAVRDSLGE